MPRPSVADLGDFTEGASAGSTVAALADSMVADSMMAGSAGVDFTLVALEAEVRALAMGGLLTAAPMPALAEAASAVSITPATSPNMPMRSSRATPKATLSAIQDLSPREVVLFTPLVVITLWMGIYPSSFSSFWGASVANMIADHQAALHAPVTLAAVIP